MVDLPTGTASAPLSRREFEAWLEAWYRSTHDPTLEAVGTYGQRALLWVTDKNRTYRLNADTRRHGVREYLDLLHQHGQGLTWSVVANRRGAMNKVVFGPEQAPIRGFYMYLA